MIVDVPSFVQHALLFAGALLALRIWLSVDRAVYRASTVVLFCTGQYGWALIAFVLLCIAESTRRRLLAEDRAAGLYDGQWID